MMRTLMLGLLLVVAATGTALGMEGPSASLGKVLFESTALGRSGKSCSTCHPGGKGLDGVKAYGDTRLREIVNGCIRQALQGEALDPQAQELESLLLYLRSLGS